ncbi:hypothetical protein [Fructobacillus cardui]|uniref:hypothetical protein n=1 Tax=Fructobacillus cardui TaxID=2893170 RepID=UPI0030C808A7
MRLIKSVIILAIKFEVIGISFFNIVLLLLAKSTSTSSFLVAAVSIATVLPGVASAFPGKISGSVQHKTRWIITLTLCQSSLFFVLAALFHGNHNHIAFALIINIVSDMAGIVINLMKMPIIQNKVDENLQQQAMGIYQSISQLIQPIGQAIGVSYIGLTHDYMTGSLLNGVTFLISAIILSVSHKHLDYQSQQVDSEPGQAPKSIKFKEALRL